MVLPSIVFIVFIYLFIVCLFFCVLNFKQRTEMLFHTKRGHSKIIVQLLMDIIWKQVRATGKFIKAFFEFPPRSLETAFYQWCKLHLYSTQYYLKLNVIVGVVLTSEAVQFKTATNILEDSFYLNVLRRHALMQEKNQHMFSVADSGFSVGDANQLFGPKLGHP